jgi:hypothetical protein
MNCTGLLQHLGFECAPRPNNGARIFSPFTFSDGTHLGVYVEPLQDGKLLVTDHGDAFMHLSGQGVKITPRRLRWAATRCAPVDVSEGGALQLVSDTGRIGAAVAAVLDASLRIAHQQVDWAPSIAAAQFTELVAEEIKAIAPEKVRRSVTVIGVSGHQIEFPIGVALPDRSIAFVQPISSDGRHIDWAAVYRATGKMTDIQQAGIDADRRLIVLDDSSARDDAARAITLLHTSATVLPFSTRETWLERFAA